MKLLPARTSRTQPGRVAGGVGRSTDSARGDAALEDGTIGRAEEHHGMLGVGVPRLPDHHAGLGPDVDVLDARHAGHDLPVTGELLIDEVELIGGSPDVGAGRFDRERSTREDALPTREGEPMSWSVQAPSAPLTPIDTAADVVIAPRSSVATAVRL